MRVPALVSSLAALVAACSAGTGAPATPPPPPDEAEVPRAAVELLVERASRTGARSHYTMSPDGSRVAPFHGIPLDAQAAIPSPDGRTLALLRYADGDVHLWLMDRDGAGLRPLLVGARVVHEVAWAPDGARLVLSQSTLEDSADLVVVNADGTGERHLTVDPANAAIFDREPAWSPDGSRVAFSSNASGITRLWLIGADGAGPRQVLPATLEASERAPAWSPDGALLAFRTSSPEVTGLGLVGPDGTGRRTFPVAALSGGPAWSPDGRLLYASSATGNSEVYALDVATGVSANLTRHLDHDLSARPLRHVARGAWRGLEAARRTQGGAAGGTVLAAGDFVADGLLDLALLDPATAQIRLLRGTGGGAFQPVGAVEVGAGAAGLVVADVSRDGAADLVVAEAAALRVFRGGPGGTGVATEHPLPGPSTDLVAVDLDADAEIDLAPVVARPGQAGFRLPVHASSPSAGELIWTLDYAAGQAGAGKACAGDATGEGHQDLVVLAGAAAVLVPGQGDITLGAPVVAATGLPPDAAAEPRCVDLDGDRRSDLVVLRPGASPGGADLSVLRAVGGTFGSPTVRSVQGETVAAADLDRDGDVDLVVAGPASGSAAFLRNLGDGRFAGPVAIPVGGAPRRLLAADLDGDLWPDLAVADADGSVAVLRNLGAAPP